MANQQKVSNGQIKGLSKNGKWKVMIADDEQGIHDVTKIALKHVLFRGKTIEFLHAYSAKEAAVLIEEHPDTALIFLDMVMEDDSAGLKVIKHIRQVLKNSLVRIILRTGQPGQITSDELIVNYDINDYKTKDELTTDKLFSTLLLSLRVYSELNEREKLQNSLKIFQGIAETMEVGIIITDMKGTIMYINKYHTKMHGYGPGDLIGKNARVLAPEHLWEPLDVEQILERGTWSRESVNIRKDKTLFNVNLVSNLIKHDNGDPFVIVTSCENIQNRKTMEKEGRRRCEHLSRLIGERTFQLKKTNKLLQDEIEEHKKTTEKKEELIKELSLINETLKQNQEQISQFEKMASLGQVIADVSHEINTPLSFVSSNISTLQKFIKKIIYLVESYNQFLLPKEIEVKALEIKEEVKYEYIKTRLEEIIERTKHGLERMKRIVIDLKTYARHESSELDEININGTIEATIDMLSNDLKAKVSLVKNYGNVPKINGYESRLEQVFTNLLVNACQAIEKKGKVTIRTSLEKGCVRIDISDTGSGIPKDKLDTIFKPFYTTKPQGIGTGLGLSISHRIIHDHKGELTVESDEGLGTTFTITLPAEEQNSD